MLIVERGKTYARSGARGPVSKVGNIDEFLNVGALRQRTFSTTSEYSKLMTMTNIEV